MSRYFRHPVTLVSFVLCLLCALTLVALPQLHCRLFIDADGRFVSTAPERSSVAVGGLALRRREQLRLGGHRPLFERWHRSGHICRFLLASTPPPAQTAGVSVYRGIEPVISQRYPAPR